MPADEVNVTEGSRGDVVFECVLSPASIPSRDGVVSVQGGCLLLENRKVSCWGTDYGVRPPDDGSDPRWFDYPFRRIPKRRRDLDGAVEVVSTGFGHCALQDDGSVKCVGVNVDGCMGHGEVGDWVSVGQVENLPNIVQLATSGWAVCGLDTEGSVWCWGDGYGVAPQNIEGLPRFTALSSSCGLTQAGKVYCWGPIYGDEVIEVPVPPAAELRRGCVVTEAGEAWCWRFPQFASNPVRFLEGFAVEHLAVGSAHVCASERGTERIVCDGQNEHGQLGCGVLADCLEDHLPACQ